MAVRAFPSLPPRPTADTTVPRGGSSGRRGARPTHGRRPSRRIVASRARGFLPRY